MKIKRFYIVKYVMIKIKFLLGNCCIKIQFCNHFHSTQLIYSKREGSGAGSASRSVFVTNGSGCKDEMKSTLMNVIIAGVSLNLSVLTPVRTFGQS